jgi:hypothetical protein
MECAWNNSFGESWKELRKVAAAEEAGERTRPRVQFPASRRKTLFGGTLRQPPDGDAYAPQTIDAADTSENSFRVF